MPRTVVCVLVPGLTALVVLSHLSARSHRQMERAVRSGLDSKFKLQQ